MQKPGTVPYNYICVIFITIGMYTNGYIASLTTPYKSKTIIYYYRLDTATEDFRKLLKMQTASGFCKSDHIWICKNYYTCLQLYKRNILDTACANDG